MFLTDSQDPLVSLLLFLSHLLQFKQHASAVNPCFYSVSGAGGGPCFLAHACVVVSPAWPYLLRTYCVLDSHH